MFFSLNCLNDSLINMNRVIIYYHHHYSIIIIIVLLKHQQKELTESVKKIFDVEIIFFNVCSHSVQSSQSLRVIAVQMLHVHSCLTSASYLISLDYIFQREQSIISGLILNRHICLMSSTHFLIEDRLVKKDKIICCELMYIISICLSQILIST